MTHVAVIVLLCISTMIPGVVKAQDSTFTASGLSLPTTLPADSSNQNNISSFGSSANTSATPVSSSVYDTMYKSGTSQYIQPVASPYTTDTSGQGTVDPGVNTSNNTGTSPITAPNLQLSPTSGNTSATQPIKNNNNGTTLQPVSGQSTPLLPTSQTQTTNGNQYTLLEPLPCNSALKNGAPGVVCDKNNPDQVTSLNTEGYVQYMFNLLIAISAVAAIFMIVLGGFIYMTSDSLTGKSAGKEKIQHAVEGLLMVLCSYLILRTINPQFVNIPTTLVTKLNTTVKYGLMQDANIFQDDVFGNNITAAINSYNKATSDLANLNQQKSIIQQQIDSYSGKPLTDQQEQDLKNLQKNLTQIQDQINQTEATQTLQQGISTLQTIVAKNTIDSTTDDMQAAMNSLSDTYDNTIKNLAATNGVGQPYVNADGYKTTVGDELLDQYNYTMAQTMLQQEQLVKNGAPSVGTYIKDVLSGSVLTGSVLGSVLNIAKDTYTSVSSYLQKGDLNDACIEIYNSIKDPTLKKSLNDQAAKNGFSLAH